MNMSKQVCCQTNGAKIRLESENMEVHLSADQQARLDGLATDKGCEAGVLAREAINRYLEQESRFVEAVSLGEAELAAGKYLSHDEVGLRIQQMFRA